MAVGTASSSRTGRSSRFNWVIGTPYFVQGTTGLTEIPILYFIKFTLGMGDVGGQLFDSLKSAGWLVKPVWGLISDTVPILGYRRKGWYVLMALLAVMFWGVAALLDMAGVRIPVLYLIVFNLALTAYAFVDVVCDALMVEEGQRRRSVGSFVNLQWTALGVASAGALLLGGRLQELIEAGAIDTWAVFLFTAIPPMVTAVVGLQNIEEEPVTRHRPAQAEPIGKRVRRSAVAMPALLRATPGWVARGLRANRILVVLILFIFFWKFSPSIGFIERSYLIDRRGFDPSSFGVILAANGITFLVSIVVYRWFVGRFPGLAWHKYLYAMVAIGVLSFPLSFFLYLDPAHPWWSVFEFALPASLNPLPGWNRYEWFRLAVQTILGFATIPAFIIPLTIAGETVKAAFAGISYALLTSLANATDVIEGVIGAGLYALFTMPMADGLVGAFNASPLEIAGSADRRTVVLELFVYISLVFTLLTIPFIELLRREIERRGIAIRLGEDRQ